MPRRRVIKNKRKTVLRVSALLGGVLLVAAILTAGYILIKRIPSSPQAQLSELSFSAADNYVYTGGGFLYEKEGSIYYDDITNEKGGYSLPIGQGEFNLAGSSKIQLIYNNKEFQIIGQNFPTEIAGALRSLKCGVSFVAALRGDGDDQETERIQLYDSSGTTLFDQLGSDQFIVDYGFYDADSEYLYIISLSLVGSTPVSTITLYNATRISTSGVIPVQSQLIEQLRFTKQSLFAIGTNHIIRYSLSDNRESYRSTVYGWKLLDYDAAGTNPVFLLKPRLGESLGTVKLLTLSDSGVINETSRMLQLPAGTVCAYIVSGKLVTVLPNSYILYDLTGKQTGEYEFPHEIEEATKLGGGLLLLRSGMAYYTLKIS